MTPRPNRCARINVAWLAFLASAVVLIVLVALLFWNSPRGPGLILYCAAGIRPPVQQAASDYQKEYGVEVQLQYGGSQTLLANIEASQRGDLYLPADDSYLDLARAKGMIKEVIPLARMTPVLAVHQGNPKNLYSLDDLMRDGVRLAEANPEAAAIGKVSEAVLTKAGRYKELQKNIIVTKPTVNDVGNDIVIGAVDAGFVWDATVRQNPQLEAITLPVFADVHSLVAVGVLTMSKQPAAALRFSRYLGARDKGLPLFQRDGYEPVEGDSWTEAPKETK